MRVGSLLIDQVFLLHYHIYSFVFGMKKLLNSLHHPDPVMAAV